VTVSDTQEDMNQVKKRSSVLDLEISLLTVE